MSDDFDMTEAERVDRWQKRLSRAEEYWKPFHDLIEETRKYYGNEKKQE